VEIVIQKGDAEEALDRLQSRPEGDTEGAPIDPGGLF
jgi:chemotaxis protein MotB